MIKPYGLLYRLTVLPAVLLTVLPCGHAEPSGPATQEASASLPSPLPPSPDEIHQFGLVECGTILHHSFRLSDPDGPAEESRILYKNCSCLEARLVPHDGGAVELALKMDVHPGWQQAYAAVEFSPSGTIRRYGVNVFGKDSFHITPSIAYMEAPEGGRVDHPVRIEFFADANSTAEFVRFSTEMDELTCDPPKAAETVQDLTKKIEFVSTLHYDAGAAPQAVREITGHCEFTLFDGQKEYVVPMQLIVKTGQAPYRLIPPKVFMMASGQSANPPSRLTLQYLHSPAPPSIEIAIDEGLPLKGTIDRPEASVYSITLEVQPDRLEPLPRQLHKGNLLIYPQGTAHPEAISVPISLFVRSK